MKGVMSRISLIVLLIFLSSSPAIAASSPVRLTLVYYNPDSKIQDPRIILDELNKLAMLVSYKTSIGLDVEITKYFKELLETIDNHQEILVLTDPLIIDAIAINHEFSPIAYCSNAENAGQRKMLIADASILSVDDLKDKILAVSDLDNLFLNTLFKEFFRLDVDASSFFKNIVITPDSESAFLSVLFGISDVAVSTEAVWLEMARKWERTGGQITILKQSIPMDPMILFSVGKELEPEVVSRLKSLLTASNFSMEMPPIALFASWKEVTKPTEIQEEETTRPEESTTHPFDLPEKSQKKSP